MKKMSFPFASALCAIAAAAAVAVGCTNSDSGSEPYAVLAPASFPEDSSAWEAVVSALQQRHGASVLRFTESPLELEASLKELYPRYVAVVDVPENIGRDYVIGLNRMSRRMDSDPYADFLWGIVTGYDAEGALRMVEDSQEPMVIRTGVGSIKELESAKWFDSYAFVDDHQVGMCGEKKPGDDTLTMRRISYVTDMTGANGRIREYVHAVSGTVCRMC